MSRLLKALRVPALAGALLLAAAGTAAAAPLPAAEPIEIANCMYSCSAPVPSQGRIVVGDQYATLTVSATGISAPSALRWGIKWSPNGRDFYRLRETEWSTTRYGVTLSRLTRPDLFPGWFRVVGLNEGLAATGASASLQVR
jgi:hypothetical protein